MLCVEEDQSPSCRKAAAAECSDVRRRPAGVWAAPLSFLLGALCTAFIVSTGTHRKLTDFQGQWPDKPSDSTPPPVPEFRLPWAPLLTQEELARGLSHTGTGQRLRAVAAKLLAGQPIVVNALGGSVTAGRGASNPSKCFASRLFQIINATFPHRGHVFLNKGIGATGSGIFAACAHQIVSQDADLLVTEFSINDPEMIPFTSPDRRGYEQLLRTLLRLPRSPAVLQLHHYAWYHPSREREHGMDAGLFYEFPLEQDLTVYAQYYDIPSISVRSALYPLMQAGVHGFKVDRVRKEPIASYKAAGLLRADPGTEAAYFYADQTHPADQGHQMLAELLAFALLRAVGEVVSQQPAVGQAAAHVWTQGKRRGLPASGLPPPMVPGSQDQDTTLCAIQEGFKPMVVAAEGFAYKPERPGAPNFVAQKWGWSADTPGAWAELQFDTRKQAGTNSSSQQRQPQQQGRDDHALVYLTYLASYAGMGTASVACARGCRCVPQVLDGTWDRQESLQQIFVMHVTQHPRCQVRVQVRAEPGQAPQQGHKVQLTGLIVSHYPVRLGARPDHVDTLAATLG